jgi:putative transposase
MARQKKHTPEHVVNLLRQIEVAVANGKTTLQPCKEAEIREQTYYRWRKEYGGLQVDQERRLVLPIKSFSLPNSARIKGSRSSS